MRKIFESLSFFANTATVLQVFGNLLTLIFIGGSGIYSSYIAKNSPILEKFGSVGWMVFGLAVASIVTLIFYGMNAISLLKAKEHYYDVISSQSTQINPLGNLFENVIIRIEYLYLPGTLLH